MAGQVRQRKKIATNRCSKKNVSVVTFFLLFFISVGTTVRLSFSVKGA